MAYKPMRRVTAVGEQLASTTIAAVMLVWLVTRPSIHWTSWLLAAIVLPMSLYFAWPRRNRQRCEGCGSVMPTSEPL